MAAVDEEGYISEADVQDECDGNGDGPRGAAGEMRVLEEYWDKFDAVTTYVIRYSG